MKVNIPYVAARCSDGSPAETGLDNLGRVYMHAGRVSEYYICHDDVHERR